jgi:hypothetical protein
LSFGGFCLRGVFEAVFQNEFGKGEKKEKKQICKCLALGPADGGPTDEKKKRRKLKRQKRKKEKKRERDPAPPPPGLLLKA